MEKSTAAFWRFQGRRTALRHNLGWWFSYFLPASVILSVIFACLVLMLRHAGSLPTFIWYSFAGTLLLASLWAWRQGSCRFIRTHDGLVRLDDQLRLNNWLTTAAAGLIDFPDHRSVDDGFRWRWSRILVPMGGAVAVLFASAFLPVERSVNELLPVEQPPAWTDVADWTEELEKSESIEKQSLERLREQLSELRDQPENEWYGPGSLEAGDALREQTAQSIDALRRNLQTAASALAAAQQLSETAALADDNGALRKKLAAALDGLEMGNLPLDRDLLGQLKNVDLSKLKKLDPKQLSKLSEAMKRGLKACAACNGIEGGEGVNALLFGTQPAKGGVSRGPGAAPLSLNPLPTDLGTTRTEGIVGGDMSRALPGEVISVQRSEPLPASTPPAVGGGPAGGISSAGSGGETVWRNDLTPQEREVLKRFFK